VEVKGWKEKSYNYEALLEGKSQEKPAFKLGFSRKAHKAQNPTFI